MECIECNTTIYRARIVDGKDYCRDCAPALTPLLLSGVRAVYGNFKGTKAHLNDIRSRKLSEDKTVYREKPSRSYL